jgi:hypothetical protein
MMLPMSSMAMVWAIAFVFGGWQAAATGSISGTLKDATGAPRVGVRVVAMAVPVDGTTPIDSGVFVSITQTDASGRYVLANVAAGRYYIAAGLVTLPTYYPGTADISEAAVVRVGAGAALSNYDFTPVVSTARSDLRVQVSVRILAEDGKPFSGPARVLATSVTPQTLLRGGATPPNLSLPGGDYTFEVVGLPLGYALKSISYRGADKGLGLVTVDTPGDLVLTVGAVAQIRGFRFSGRLVDVAPELLGNPRTLRLKEIG